MYILYIYHIHLVISAIHFRARSTLQYCAKILSTEKQNQQTCIMGFEEKRRDDSDSVSSYWRSVTCLDKDTGNHIIPYFKTLATKTVSACQYKFWCFYRKRTRTADVCDTHFWKLGGGRKNPNPAHQFLSVFYVQAADVNDDLVESKNKQTNN